MNKKSFTRRTKLIFLAGAFAALALSTGCVDTAKTEAAGFAYVDGILTTTLKAELNEAVRAARSAINQLGLTRAGEDRDELTDVLVARNAANRRVEIKLEYAGAGSTRLTIQVGSFGDQALSVAILDKLKANL